MSTLHLTRGLQASGKTTFARDWVAADVAHRVRINRDDLRMMTQGVTWRDNVLEEHVSIVQQQSVRAALRAGRDVIVDDTNLNAGIVKAWLKLAGQTGSDVAFHDFPIELGEAVARDLARRLAGERSVGQAAIVATHARYLAHLKGGFPIAPTMIAPLATPDVVPYVAKPGTPRAIIVDIDGTLARHVDRSPYDYSRVHTDEAIMPIVDLVELLASDGKYDVLIMSGRPDSCRDETVAWLGGECSLYPWHYAGLFMRATGDNRDDRIVKAELFDAHVRDLYDVRYVLDDRNRVVNMWRALGLTVLQVADGDF